SPIAVSVRPPSFVLFSSNAFSHPSHLSSFSHRSTTAAVAAVTAVHNLRHHHYEPARQPPASSSHLQSAGLSLAARMSAALTTFGAEIARVRPPLLFLRSLRLLSVAPPSTSVGPPAPAEAPALPPLLRLTWPPPMPRPISNRTIFNGLQPATLSPPILLSMVYYIDRLCALYPAFTVSSLTIHRFLIASATVASKGLSDSFWTNKTYARVGGISMAELALLELEFLFRVEWRIVPQPEVLVDYYQSLVERCDGYEILREG
ncbi:uncharacterized protein P174DRAFT_446570, partial [Aspergillus novofumigatus IBT 16806]